MRIVAIIQARVQSTRLPGKVLLPLRQKPVVNHIIDRLGYSEKVTDVILAVPDDEENAVLRKLAHTSGIEYVLGSQEDVLSRYKTAVDASEADVIIRVTGDSPLISPYIVDLTVESLLEKSGDYAVMRGTPLGVESEVITRDAFERVLELATEPEMREHATLAVYKFPDKFDVHLLTPPKEYERPDIRLTLDAKEDYILLKSIFDNVQPAGPFISIPEVLAHLDANPDLASMNRGVEQRMSDFLADSKEVISGAGNENRTPED